jgi:energy-coupling factor transporter transmembrane protein EcfT
VILHKQTQHWTAFLFGAVFVIVLLTVAIFFPNPTAFQYIIFRSVLSLAVAGVAAMIPGFIRISVSKWLRAGGALAVFAAVYFYNPAALVSSAPSQINDIKGDQNQVINGNTGRVSITNDKSTPKGTKIK